MTGPVTGPVTGYAAFASARVLSEGGAALPAKVAAATRHAVHPDDLLRGPVTGPDGTAVFEAECLRLVVVDLAAAFDPAGPGACLRCAAALTDPDGSAAAAARAAVQADRRADKAARQRVRRAARRAEHRARTAALTGAGA